MTEKPIIGAAVELALLAKQMKRDPRETYVALMTAAALAGHIIEQTPREMEEVLMKVEGMAHLKLLEITGTKQ